MATNINYSYDAGIAPSVKEYYSRTLVDMVKSDAVHMIDLEETVLPKGQSGTIEFRRAMPLPISTAPLVEGVTPDGQRVTIEKFTATIAPYGNYIATTDELDWKTIDSMHKINAELLAEQAKNSLDAIAKEKLHSGLNVRYAGNATSRATIKVTDKLTYDEINKTVTALIKNGAKPFGDGKFHAIVDANVEYDLMNDPLFIDVAKYQDKSIIEKGEIGTFGRVRFFRSQNGKVFGAETNLFDAVTSLTIESYDPETKTIKLNAASTNALTEQARRILAGKLVDIADNAAAKVTATIDRVYSDGRVVLKYVPAAAAVAKWKAGGTATPAIVPTGGGAVNVTVYSTLVYGKGHAGKVALESGGAKPKTIIKPLGSAGSTDPLDQRQTIGWKVSGFTVAVLQDLFMTRIEHGATLN